MFRTLFYVLLTANLLFLAWAHWAAPESGLQAPPSVAAATAAKPVALPPAPPAPTSCTSLGPFRDTDALAQAAGALSAAGKAPRPRTQPGQQSDGFAVAVGGLQDAATVQVVLAKLKRAGISDALPMGDATPPRLLVGSFPDRAAAEQRATRLRGLKLEAAVEEQFHSVQQHWLDLPGDTPQSLAPEQLAHLGLTAPELVTAPCP